MPGPVRPRVAGARRRPAPPPPQPAAEGAQAGGQAGPGTPDAARAPDGPPAPALPVAADPGVPAGPPVAGPGVADGPGLLVVGRVGKPQGIRGEVTVEVRTDDPDARFAAGTALPTEPPGRGPLVVGSVREQNGRLVVLFDGVTDRNGAEALRGTLLMVDAATLPPVDDPDEFHDFELVGLAAELPDGRPLGRLAEVLHLPQGDVLVVRGEQGEVLVPFVAAMVPVVDVPAGRVVIDPPEGLLDLPGAG